MKNKGAIQVFTALLFLVSLYQLSFTWKTRQVEKKAWAEAQEKGISVRQVLDSLNPEIVYNLGITKFSYQECKKRELNLGLDLQGGMNVTLEVSVPDILRALAEYPEDPKFKAAMEKAVERNVGEQDFVSLFREEYEQLSPSKGLAEVFMRRELKGVINFDSDNEEVYKYLREESGKSVARAYQIINTRVDEFGVSQPNVQRLDGGRISVELPGVDNPERIRKILQSSAKLEFWNTYQNFEAFKFLEEANKVVRKIQELNDTSESDEAISELSSLGESDEPVEENELALSAEENSNDSSDMGLLAGNDSAGSLSDSAANANKSPEQLAKENPVLSRLYPNLREDGRWQESAIVGFVMTKDRKLIEDYLALPEVQAVIPANVKFRWSFKPSDKEGRFYMLYALKSNRDDRPVLEGDVVTDARPVLETTGEVKVTMSMNAEGAKDWKRITAKASQAQPFKECVAIVLDDLVYSAPTVQGEIPNGISEISGGFTQQEANDLSNILKAGKLPAPARIVEESVVGPTLGQKAIRAGLISLLVGFVLVIIFMMSYYARAGVYSVIALLANMIFIIGVLSGLGAALTLPGMAGLVLTIGMAVDANVLIFERVREELSSGISLKQAVKKGYEAAFSSIIDANITTLIAGMLLWSLGEGPVKGFAVILVIGILSSLFTAILLTRMLVERDLKNGVDTTFSTGFSKELFSNINLNFIGNRKKFYIVSSVIIVIGLVSLFTKGLSTGVDFKGGWTYVMQFEDNTNSTDIKNALSSGLQANSEVKSYGTDNQFKITTSYLIDSKDADASEQVESAVLTTLADFGVEKSDILSSSKVGPTIAEDIKLASTWAVILAIIGMFAYIVLRFRKWGFGLGATAALFHDVLIVFSIYSIFWGIFPFAMDIDQAFIAAILTVVGYSINDTVVVFDRVREFLSLHKHETDSPMVVNNAINQTLSRTLVTSLTTLLVILVLFLFGGEGLKGFTFALLVGVAVGTYSSVCIATPIVTDFIRKKK